MTDLDEIRRIEEHWPIALRDRDRSWLEAHTTDGFVCIDPNGLMDRTRYLDHRAEENETIIDGRNTVERAEVFGDTALLVNRAEFVIETADGTTRQLGILGSNVYVRVDGSWRLALLHLSEHPPGAGRGEAPLAP